jgi:hypothetical protein
MHIFSNTADRQKLQDAEESKFIEQCRDEFIEKSLAITNARKVRQLTVVSYLPNLLSATTAGFFVLYLLSGYTRTVALVLGALLLIIVVAIEAGKRGLIVSAAKDFFNLGKVSPLPIAALAACFALSMGASYLGGKQLVVATAAPPAKETNPEIAAIQAQLADISGTVDRLRKTTWRGKVTVDAVRGINKAQSLQAALTERLTTLQAQDDATHAAKLQKHTAKHLNFGVMLGLLAAVSDLFLLGLLWTAKRLKYEVAAIHYHPTPSTSAAPANGFSAQFQTPSFNTWQQQHTGTPAPSRRPIGFKVYQTETGTPAQDGDPDAMRKNAIRLDATPPGGKIRGCAWCGNDFEARTTWHKYCCEACKIAAWEARTGKPFKKKAKA